MKQLNFFSWDADKLTNEELSKVENAIGSLPEDYRHFLQDSNGGRNCDGTWQLKVIDHTQASSPKIKLQFKTIEIVDPEFPPPIIPASFSGNSAKLVPIAGDSETSILMAIDEQRFGEVIHWKYSQDAAWKAEDSGSVYMPNESNTVFIATSFTDFLGLLTNKTKSRKQKKLSDLEPTVGNYARYGDQSITDATEFLDQYSVEQLEETWPKEAKYQFTPLYSACAGAQTLVMKYLIGRGVNITEVCGKRLGYFELAKILIDAGASKKDQQAMLLAACQSIDSTSKPEEPVKIVQWLTENGIQPASNDDDETALRWTKAIRQIFNKKVLRFISQHVQLPTDAQKLIDKKLSKPNSLESAISWFDGNTSQTR